MWSHTTPWERSTVLDRAGTEVLARADELGDLLAREEGKTLPEAKGEAVRAGQILKYFAGDALRPSGTTWTRCVRASRSTVTREPIGVVSVITPWNFPIAIPAWKIAPALAYGNTVVFKPAELVPGSAWELADILSRAGLPAGALNLVLGRGSVVGPALATDPLVNGVTFTGSVATGRGILDAHAPLGRKFQLELGGKNPLVVLDDADLATAVEVPVQGGFGSTGQRCTASSYAVVTDAIHDRLVEAVHGTADPLDVGDARAPGTDIGTRRRPAAARAGPALPRRRAARGRRGDAAATCSTSARPATTWRRPSCVGTKAMDRSTSRRCSARSRRSMRASDYDEALATANATDDGPVLGYGDDRSGDATHFRRSSKAGMVMVNLPTAGVDFHVPFGGRRRPATARASRASPRSTSSPRARRPTPPPASPGTDPRPVQGACHWWCGGYPGREATR